MSLLTNKKLYLNIGVALALFVVIVVAVLMSLKSWTRHGESILLPDFREKPVEELERFVKDNHLNYKIIDSVYNDYLPKGTIVLQDPYPNSGVKRGRNIYISVVSSLPESVVMPDVVNLSVRQAVSLIYGNNLTISKIDFVSGFDKNAVQKQLVDGQEVEPGTKLKKFTAVTLVASKGERSESHKVPNLKGLTKRDAMQRLFQNSFNVGNIVGDDEKNVGAVVVSQTPLSDKSDYPLGHKVSFRLSGGKASDGLDSLIWNSVTMDQDDEDEIGESLDDSKNEVNNEEIF
ncbi:MAG: PASTA domain-containing protein [Bacteroidales bacterium]|jgi:beta-lactam-binding protein with PASTA domain|nr:PASTA domain-containing protein [Bacteroidales bacterium]